MNTTSKRPIAGETYTPTVTADGTTATAMTPPASVQRFYRAFTAGQVAQAEKARAARDFALDSANGVITEAFAEALKTSLKLQWEAMGMTAQDAGTSLSRWFGKPQKKSAGGIYWMARRNGSIVREAFADGGCCATLTSADRICKALQAKVRSLNHPELASSGDPVADAAAAAAYAVEKKREAAAKAVSKNAGVLSSEQLAAVVLEASSQALEPRLYLSDVIERLGRALSAMAKADEAAMAKARQ